MTTASTTDETRLLAKGWKKLRKLKGKPQCWLSPHTGAKRTEEEAVRIEITRAEEGR